MSGSGGSETGATGDKGTWHVYILVCSDGTLYTGIAKDPAERLRQHNAGRGARYTRGRLPVELVYEEKADDRGSALRREHEIKRLSAAAKRKLIGGGQPVARR
ncbi:GIY-YIG nuclease family protein [Candidatus Rariloculus sp.]|uniref:GIY-YIG nuclease family protein n=1 Tax=Candidatus Rariloculus sp. TaxID=3101265 RepID=UPI003D0D1486